jgi:high-affinity iron transporter
MMRALAFLLFFALGALASGPARAADAGVQTTWRLLDYVAVDYSEAVSDGRVVNQFEYDEMLEFSKSVADRIGSLPPTAAKPKLAQRAEELRRTIRAKAAPSAVAALARGLADDLLKAHPVPLAPAEAPDVTRGSALYAQACASCHGLGGEGGRGEFAKLDPPPIAFADAERARERSVFGLYQVIGQGLEGTAMQSFASLPGEDRWALAFHSGRLAFRDAAAGERLWNGNESIRRRIPDLTALAAITPAQLGKEIGQDKADAVIAYLRTNPGAVASAQAQSGSLALVREKLRQSLAAYEAGNARAAEELALAAYLEGFEPIEGVLATRDGGLMTRAERAMAEFRAAVAAGAPKAQLRGQLAALGPLLDQAEAALAPEAATELSTFLGAFTILLREGLEALLVVIAMIAFLRKAERPEVLRYVHGGWVAALVAGAATWAAATYLVGISGASRELTEGFGALLAAVVLVSVGVWMHGKSHAEEWRRYIQEKMGRALSRGSAWFLFGSPSSSSIAKFSRPSSSMRRCGHPTMAGRSCPARSPPWSCLRSSPGRCCATAASCRSPCSSGTARSSSPSSRSCWQGKGMGALQEAGLVPLTLLPGVPRIDLLGIVPTAEAVGAQLLTLFAILYGFWASGRKSRRLSAAPAAAE